MRVRVAHRLQLELDVADVAQQVNDGVASRAFAWPRRTKTHERQPRELAYFMSQRVCPAVPVIVCRNATIGASGGSAAPSGSFDHSTITSGCAVAE